mmetsp:Transcript_51550/g.115793  ORF Transcript_51550/g.115793 Transcript_51550/m.115793 type:complete len:111 (+) Transcript_51550:338-670(+)
MSSLVDSSGQRWTPPLRPKAVQNLPDIRTKESQTIYGGIQRCAAQREGGVGGGEPLWDESESVRCDWDGRRLHLPRGSLQEQALELSALPSTPPWDAVHVILTEQVVATD